jgi:hypothetical protein
MVDAGRIAYFCRTMCVVGVMVGAGCQDQTQRSDFLARSEQDCALGDRPACSMLDVLRAQPGKVEPTRPSQPARTQVERDVEAITAGIRRARSSPRSKGVEIAPIAPPYGPFSP